jgi:hypothetical protein
MPTHPVAGRPGCYQWGNSGKIYCGAGAKAKADRQGRAIHATGWTEKASESVLTRKDMTLLAVGAVSGVLAGVLGEFLAEILLDRIRKQPELELTEPDESDSTKNP